MSQLIRPSLYCVAMEKKLRAALREVHRRVVRDYYTVAVPTAQRWWTCSLCAWVWEHGQAEVHEPTCPLVDSELRKEVQP